MPLEVATLEIRCVQPLPKPNEVFLSSKELSLLLSDLYIS